MFKAEQANPEVNRPVVQQDQSLDDGISSEEYARWLSPQQAQEVLANIWGLRTIRQELFSRLQNALVRTAAKIAIVREYGCEQSRREYKVIPETFWASRQSLPDSHFWNTGSIQIHQREHQNEMEVSFFEVRFDPDQIAEIIAGQLGSLTTASDPQTFSVGNGSGRRGARRKDWWDHLWIEMIRRIQAGTLKPKNQSKLQELLEDYVGKNLGEKYGDSTLKPMASNLFKYLQENEGKLGEG